MVDISIDLETLDIIPTAHILAVGAVKFDITTGVLGDVFYKVVNLNTQIGRTISPYTVKWWLTQTDEAQQVFRTVQTSSLQEVLESFSNFIDADSVVWGNGATFDISILDNAYQHEPPWEFRNVHDMRTILRHAKMTRGYTKPEFKGIQHNALYDAMYQANVISECWQGESPKKLARDRSRTS